MMPPETRRYLRQNLHLVHDADLRAEVQDLPDGDVLMEGENFRLIGDAARLAQLRADVGQIAGDAEAKSASRALGWWVVALLIVALCIGAFGLGYGMVKFGAYVGAKTEATVAMTAERGAW
jgi:hypothetical protein